MRAVELLYYKPVNKETYNLKALLEDILYFIIIEHIIIIQKLFLRVSIFSIWFFLQEGT